MMQGLHWFEWPFLQAPNNSCPFSDRFFFLLYLAPQVSKAKIGRTMWPHFFPRLDLVGNVVLWFPLDLFKLLLLYFLPAGMPPAGVIVVLHLVPSEDPCTTS